MTRMTRRYEREGIQLEWDDDKALSNLEKHGVSFQTACDVFFDPFVVTLERQEAEGEVRSVIVGMTAYWQVLYVVHTVRKDEVFRLISARPATRSEHRRYENY